MQSELLNGIFDTEFTAVISLSDFAICLVSALIAGLLLAMLYSIKSTSTKSFIITLAMLPAIVCVVILMVNGNVGTGVAVAGAFSLVRFRSMPGSAKEITAIFIAMGSGLIFGMGYIGYGFIFTIILALCNMAYTFSSFGEKKNQLEKTITVTIPEDLNYTNIFDDLFERYTDKVMLAFVKTTNMGSLFKLTYHMTLKDASKEKELIDEIRIRNGNLEITVSPTQTMVTEL